MDETVEEKMGSRGNQFEEESTAQTIDEKFFQCGIWTWRPRALQRFAKPIYFSLVFLLFGLFQGALKIGLNVSMTTIERKFGMSGTMISVVMIMDNVSGTIASLVLGYYATKISQIRIIVFGIWVSVASCFFFVLPQFLYGKSDAVRRFNSTMMVGQKEGQFTEFCNLTNSDFYEESSASQTTPYHVSSNGKEDFAIPVLILLSIANILNGLGGTSFYVVGTTYTDDSVKKKNTALYFGTILALRMIGPLIGVLASSYFLTIHEHLTAGPHNMSTRDPRWIGAWWLPFILWGSLSLLVSIPLVFFPRYIRRDQAKVYETPKIKEQHDVDKSVRGKIGNEFKTVGQVLTRLGTNPIFMWGIVGTVFYMNGMGGQIMNMSKYIEIQYRVSPAKASFLVGTTKLVAAAVGTFVGGLVVHAYKPSAFIISVFGVFVDGIQIVVLIVAMFLHCDSWRLGSTSFNADGSFSLTSDCNGACQCSSKFQPFCDQTTNMSYFSPCYGGCMGSNLADMSCSCLDAPVIASSWELPKRFVSGFCRNDCNNLSIFIAITAGALALASLARVGNMVIGFRCINAADKALAIGLGSFAINVLAAVPYPLIYGGIFDSHCLIWSDQRKGRGNCWYYDSERLRYNYLGTTVVFYTLAIICYMVKTYYTLRLKNIYGEDDEEENETGKTFLKEEGDKREQEEMLPQK